MLSPSDATPLHVRMWPALASSGAGDSDSQSGSLATLIAAATSPAIGAYVAQTAVVSSGGSLGEAVACGESTGGAADTTAHRPRPCHADGGNLTEGVDAGSFVSPGSTPPGSPQPDFGVWNYVNIARLEQANAELVRRLAATTSQQVRNVQHICACSPIFFPIAGCDGYHGSDDACTICRIGMSDNESALVQ